MRQIRPPTPPPTVPHRTYKAGNAYSTLWPSGLCTSTWGDGVVPLRQDHGMYAHAVAVLAGVADAALGTNRRHRVTGISRVCRSGHFSSIDDEEAAVD